MLKTKKIREGLTLVPILRVDLFWLSVMGFAMAGIVVVCLCYRL